MQLEKKRVEVLTKECSKEEKDFFETLRDDQIKEVIKMTSSEVKAFLGKLIADEKEKVKRKNEIAKMEKEKSEYIEKYATMFNGRLSATQLLIIENGFSSRQDFSKEFLASLDKGETKESLYVDLFQTVGKSARIKTKNIEKQAKLKIKEKQGTLIKSLMSGCKGLLVEYGQSCAQLIDEAPKVLNMVTKSISITDHVIELDSKHAYKVSMSVSVKPHIEDQVGA